MICTLLLGNQSAITIISSMEVCSNINSLRLWMSPFFLGSALWSPCRVFPPLLSGSLRTEWNQWIQLQRFLYFRRCEGDFPGRCHLWRSFCVVTCPYLESESYCPLLVLALTCWLEAGLWFIARVKLLELRPSVSIYLREGFRILTRVVIYLKF